MRPLSRPMFRNGGPIKEGIMDGMQDRKAALVGDPAFPMDQSGRGMYSEQQIASNLQRIKDAFSQTAKDIKTKPLSTVNPLKKTGIIGSFLRRNAGRIKNFYDRQVGKLDMPPKFKPAGPEFKGAGTAGGGSVPTSLLERAKFFATKNPKTTIGGGYLASGPVVDVATGSVPLAKKVGLQIADLAVPDFIFDQDKYFADKEIRERNEKAKQKSLEAGTTKKTGGEGEDTVKKLSRDEEIEANRKRYYKLMGIDKMQKGAAYDSLIDASRIIQEQGGDLKGAVKSGNLQNAIIQAISKNLDKSTDLKKQIDAAILKGEITKDINREKDQLDATYKKLAIDKLQNEAAGGTIKQIINTRKEKGISTSGRDLFQLAVQSGIGDNIKQILPEKQVSNFLKDNPTKTTLDFLKQVDLDLQEQQGEGLTPGDYVVGETILRVSEDGKISFVI